MSGFVVSCDWMEWLIVVVVAGRGRYECVYGEEEGEVYAFVNGGEGLVVGRSNVEDEDM